MLFRALSFPLAVGLLLAGCSPATPADDDPAATTATAPPAAAPALEKPFVGTIRLVEHHYLLGIRSTDYVTLTFDGPRLRREVRPGGFAKANERYGIIADLRTDSVTYYVQDATHNAHHRLAKSDYLACVAANAPILPELDYRPFSTVFGPLAPDAPALHSEAVAGPALRRLSSWQAVLFLLPGGTRCDVFYSERVRVPPAALAYIEHHAPAALPTLALSVHYTPPARPQTNGLLDRLQHGLHTISAHNSEFDSSTPTVAADAFDLPAGSTSNLAESVRSESGSSHHRHHHHH